MSTTNSAFKGRREDARLVTGAGRYTDDWKLPGQAHAFFRRSDRAHATIRRIDVAAARKSPGVLLVLTADDVRDAGFATLPPLQPPPGRGGQKIRMPERPMLASSRVRFVGDMIAVVIAETAAAARDAAELIEIDFEDLPAVVSFEQALAADATVIHDNIPGNVCFEFEYGDEAKAAAAIAQAHGTVTLTIDSPRVAPTPMEVRGALVAYETASESYDVYTPNQGNWALRDGLAKMAGVAADKIRVHMVDVGGAFGARTAPFPEYPVLMFAARKLQRPVKWLSTRTDDFLTDNHGRAITLTGTLAYDENGRFLALRTDWLCDSGAYLAEAGVLTNSVNGLAIGASVYEVDSLYGRHRQVMTNTSPTNAYRGAGRPEANLIVERLIDEAAAKLGVDPLKLRARNLIKKKRLPYRTLTGIMFDSGDFPGLLDKVKERSDWAHFNARRRQSRKAGKLRGIGCAMFIEPSGGGHAKQDEVAAFFKPDGSLLLHNVAGASGQGHETVFPELMAGWLGIPADRIISHGGDPAGPQLHGNPSIGSRSAMSQGSAFKVASEVIIEKAKRLAADMLEANVGDIGFADGVFTIAGTDRSVTMTQVIERHAKDTPHPLDTIAAKDISRAFPSGAHVVEVEIAEDTGAVDVVSYTAVDDVGNVINPTLANGQLYGGITQGAAQVFGERCHYDEGNGQLVTSSFMDYFMPRADLLPTPSLASHGVPSPNNPLGAKGVGEAGTTGALAACMNAVIDALRTAGVTQFDMPATPPRVWSALQGARQARPA